MSQPDSKNLPGLARRPVLELANGMTTSRSDELAEETPVAMHYNGEPFAVMLATPANLLDFAYGFSLTERGLHANDIADVNIQHVLEGVLLDIRTHVSLPPAGARQDRILPGRSGCGLCGQRLLEDVVKRPHALDDGLRISSNAIQRAIHQLQQQQPLNAATGAVHAAAWANSDGQLLWVREDIGRHNALDKLIGALQHNHRDTGHGFALVTSRASYELVTKTALAGIGILAAISAPTALAVQLALDCRLTLLGFVRDARMVVYSHPQRLQIIYS